MATHGQKSGLEITREWFDSIEKIMTEEARLAGLLNHGATIGEAREFFVRRFLRAILPPMVHIGRGKIIAATSPPSRQVDIVLFDPRFPVLEIEPGMGMYHVEGVIAAIEVKSRVNRSGLREALENCYSVCGPNLSGQGPKEDIQHRASQVAKQEGVSLFRATEMTKWALTPKTYIFAFRGYEDGGTLGKHVNQWYEEKGPPGNLYCPFLPRVIVGGNAIGLSSDNWFRLDRPDPVPGRPEMPADDKPLMMFADWEKKFGFMALHLVHAVSERLGTMHATEDVRFIIDGYLPVNAYMAQAREKVAHWLSVKDPELRAPA
jgi:hypothetical protein